jgi:hypothetical protein
VQRKVHAVTGAVTLRSQREELARKTASVRRKAHKAAHPLTRTTRSVDASGPQVRPGCEISPAKFIGQRPLTRSSGHRGLCHGCARELHLTPVRNCVGCNGWLPAWYPQLKTKRRPREQWGSYSAVMCPNCVDQTDRESVERGDTSYE